MIHKFKFNDSNFVIDVNSGSVHVVDDISYDILDFINGAFFDYTKQYVLQKLENKYDKQDISEAYEELFSIYKQGKLFSQDT